MEQAHPATVAEAGSPGSSPEPWACKAPCHRPRDPLLKMNLQVKLVLACP